jgi:hypothetical protein
MNSDDLIAALARDVPVVPRHALGRQVGMGLAAGVLATFVLVAGVLGIRHDLWVALHGAALWTKAIYTLALGLCATAATLRLARPDGTPGRWPRLVGLVVAIMLVVSLVDLAETPRGAWLALWLGHSWTVCSRNVFLLAMPIYAGLMWACRRLAPTRLRLAGAWAGIAAGGWGAALYCLHCPETAPLFVLTWYTLGIVAASLLGGLMGPRFLRW